MMSMEKKSFSDFLKFLGYDDLSLDDFWILGNSTNNADKQLEFHRGPLLYALICYLKPKKILEFGTGGGYSTLCMAKALTDSKIDGKI